MKKSMTAAALAGALSLAAMPVLTSAAFAQAAAGPEPMQGAQPMDNGGGSMDKGSMSKGSMSKGSMMKKKSSKHMMKKHKSM